MSRPTQHSTERRKTTYKIDDHLSDYERIHKYRQMEGWWKKRGIKKGFLSGISTSRFFKLFKHARVLAYFVHEPNAKNPETWKPHWVLFTRNIDQIIPRYDGQD